MCILYICTKREMEVDAIFTQAKRIVYKMAIMAWSRTAK